MEDRTGLGDRIVPALLTSDMSNTLAFFQKLGFEVTGAAPDPDAPTWAEVRRDGIVLQFHTEPPVGTAPIPIFSGTFYLFPDSVAALAEEFKDLVEFAWEPEVMSYGLFEFGIQDPNGYYFAFAEPAAG